MIPLRDTIPSERTPFTSYVLIGLNLLVFLYELNLTSQQTHFFFQLFGVVPRRLFDPVWADLRGFPDWSQISILSHMFLHAGFLHFALNMWTMYIFADNVEDSMGHGRFLLFYLLSGLGALLAHVYFNQRSPYPIVGASGAIAGVMGAYFRLFPHGRVLTLIPIFFIPYMTELPASLFLGIWFFTQLLTGVASQVQETGGAGVAWWAHAGGFAVGYLLIPLFRRPDACRYCYDKLQKRYLPESGESRQEDV